MAVVVGTQYATTTDLTSLGLIGGALATVSATIQNAVLLAASGVADASLGSRYILPLTSWGTDLVRAVAIIASYDLLTSRGFAMTQGSDENIRKRYLDALEWLDEVSKGTQSASHVVDSSTTTASGPSVGTGVDGSINTATQGGFQMVTSPVRGWTPRGGTSASGDR